MTQSIAGANCLADEVFIYEDLFLRALVIYRGSSRRQSVLHPKSVSVSLEEEIGLWHILLTLSNLIA